LCVVLVNTKLVPSDNKLLGLLYVNRLAGIERNLLQELVNFLKVFKDASDELEATCTVTLHKPLPWFHTLKKHCCIDSEDSEPMKKIKTRTTYFLDTKFKVARLHLIASALNPKMKGLKMLPDDEKQSVYEDLRCRVEQISTVSGNLTGRPMSLSMYQIKL
jgi:hypothetical protein